jgi:flagellar biosynthesis protein FlhG
MEKGEEAQGQRARVIAITSGKGGVGKTSLAANLGISFAMLGKRVVVFDGDLGVANMAVILGMIPPPKYNLYHVVTGEKTLREIVVEGPGGVKYVTGIVGVRRMANLTPKKRNELIEHLSELDAMSYLIIVDTAAGLSAATLSFVLAADDVILITTPEPTSIAAAYGIIKMVSKEEEMEEAIKLVINRVSNIMDGKRVADRIANIAGQFLSMRIEKLGYLLEDPLVGKAVRAQKPFLIAYPSSKATTCVHHIRNRLAKLPEPPRRKKGIIALFRELFGGRYTEEW